MLLKSKIPEMKGEDEKLDPELKIEEMESEEKRNLMKNLRYLFKTIS